jgi:hypothetical protein
MRKLRASQGQLSTYAEGPLEETDDTERKWAETFPRKPPTTDVMLEHSDRLRTTSSLPPSQSSEPEVWLALNSIKLPWRARHCSLIELLTSYVTHDAAGGVQFVWVSGLFELQSVELDEIPVQRRCWAQVEVYDTEAVLDEETRSVVYRRSSQTTQFCPVVDLFAPVHMVQVEKCLDPICLHDHSQIECSRRFVNNKYFIKRST